MLVVFSILFLFLRPPQFLRRPLNTLTSLLSFFFHLTHYHPPPLPQTPTQRSSLQLPAYSSSVTMASNNTLQTLPSKITIPDLVSHCTYKIRMNRNRKQASAESKKWLFRGDNLSGKKRDAYHGLKAGLLTAMCYPDAGYPQLRVCMDFMNYLFHRSCILFFLVDERGLTMRLSPSVDNLSDDMDTRGTITTADVVLNSLYHPYTFQSSARVGRMTREYVIPSHLL